MLCLQTPGWPVHGAVPHIDVQWKWQRGCRLEGPGCRHKPQDVRVSWVGLCSCSLALRTPWSWRRRSLKDGQTSTTLLLRTCVKQTGYWQQTLAAFAPFQCLRHHEQHSDCWITCVLLNILNIENKYSMWLSVVIALQQKLRKSTPKIEKKITTLVSY